MIVVVADTSPLNYLVRINCEHVLPALYAWYFYPRSYLKNSIIPEQSPPFVSGSANYRPGSRSAMCHRALIRIWRNLTLENARRFNWPNRSTPTCC